MKSIQDKLEETKKELEQFSKDMNINFYEVLGKYTLNCAKVYKDYYDSGGTEIYVKELDREAINLTKESYFGDKKK